MKSISKNILLALTALCGSGLAQANDTVVVKGTIRAPTCTIAAPSILDLGDLVKGKDVALTPFEVSITCPKPVKMEVFAQALTPGVGDSNGTKMRMVGPSNFVQFWMEYGGTIIKVDGDTNTADSGFCVGTDSRICELTPWTWVSPDKSAPGDYTAAVRLDVRYKA